MRACPTCDRPRRQRQVMCKVCWYLVPKALRDKVWEAYRKKDEVASRIAVRQAITAVKRLTI